MTHSCNMSGVNNAAPGIPSPGGPLMRNSVASVTNPPHPGRRPGDVGLAAEVLDRAAREDAVDGVVRVAEVAAVQVLRDQPTGVTGDVSRGDGPGVGEQDRRGVGRPHPAAGVQVGGERALAAGGQVEHRRLLIYQVKRLVQVHQRSCVGKGGRPSAAAPDVRPAN
jgi:hypothetical protein